MEALPTVPARGLNARTARPTAGSTGRLLELYLKPGQNAVLQNGERHRTRPP